MKPQDNGKPTPRDSGHPAGNRPPGSNSCSECGDSTCSASRREEHETDDQFAERQDLQSRMCRIRKKILVLSGKGGVGKSTVAVNLAVSLMLKGYRVGILDVDIHGPSIPTMLGLEQENIQRVEGELLPVDVGGMKVMSLGFFLDDPDEAVIWRGPMKTGVIKQFLKDVAWGDLDYLIIDSPPGTGDEPLSVIQLIGRVDGAVVVTTPQKVAAVDVRKSITFCRRLETPVLGVIENMSGFACPCCGEITPILGAGGGKRMAEEMGIPFLGSIPIDSKIAETGDEGAAFVQRFAVSPTASVFRDIVMSISVQGSDEAANQTPHMDTLKERPSMRIAIPLADGTLCSHFGHCEKFALVDVDPVTKKIVSREDVEAPPHQPGLLPPWLAEQGAKVIIAGGMGHRAQLLFAEQGIQVVVGVPVESPEELVTAYLEKSLQSGANPCDH